MSLNEIKNNMITKVSDNVYTADNTFKFEFTSTSLIYTDNSNPNNNITLEKIN